MGDNHTETIITLLRAWLVVSRREINALEKGDLDQLQNLIDSSVQIKERIDAAYSRMEKPLVSREEKQLFTEIQQIQNALILEMQKGSSALQDRIKAIMKNTASLKGYKQSPPKKAKFLNEHS